jgi:hypothetical protein
MSEQAPWSHRAPHTTRMLRRSPRLGLCICSRCNIYSSRDSTHLAGRRYEVCREATSEKKESSNSDSSKIDVHHACPKYDLIQSGSQMERTSLYFVPGVTIPPRNATAGGVTTAVKAAK